MIFYLISNELIFYTLKEIMIVGGTLAACMLGYSVLLCILVARQNKRKGGHK